MSSICGVLQIYCLDFGISDRYVMATGKHKEYKVGTIVGTPTFLSLNCHAGASTSMDFYAHTLFQ